MLAAGYAYNLTFVQLGLSAFARDRVALSDAGTAVAMGGLAVGTTLAALVTGVVLAGAGFRVKLRVAAVAVGAQSALTLVLPGVDGVAPFLAWLALAAVVLGVAVPATFGLATDLVPVHLRGMTAAAITSVAYGGAIAFLGEWDAVALAGRLGAPMALGSLALAAFAFLPGPTARIVAALGRQHALPTFGDGRFAGTGRRRLLVAVGVMFGIFFVDSLGFVRLVDSPFVTAAWQSPDLLDREALIVAHVLGALVGGILYQAFDERLLFPWIFGIFALVAMSYVLDLRVGNLSQALAGPLLYALGVSLYTVLTFALWPDLSTPRTITRIVVLGVALSGWMATFVSTGLALAWRASGLDLERHLSAVAAVGLVVLAGFGLRWLIRSPVRVRADGMSGAEPGR